MARKKKKKSLLLTGAGLAARIILEKRIIKKEQKRAAARAEGGRSALQARVKKPVLDEALYHALGGKASNDSLKLKAARKALKQKEALQNFDSLCQSANYQKSTSFFEKVKKLFN